MLRLATGDETIAEFLNTERTEFTEEVSKLVALWSLWPLC